MQLMRRNDWPSFEMRPTMMRILLLSLSPASSEAVNTALAGQGYEIATGGPLTVEEILARSPDVLVTEARPSDLSCCGLITQLKSEGKTGSSIKVVMIVDGGALERARGLDLGTDDVISFPFDAVEFAAKVRTQFRERKPEEELKTKLERAVERAHYADIAVESLTGQTVGKRRFRLLPAYFALAATVVGGLLTAISIHGSRKDTLQLRVELARLNSGLQSQAELRRGAQQARSSVDANFRSATAASDSLRTRSEDLRKKLAVSDGADADSLSQQLLDTQNRLSLLEKEGKFAESIVHKYGPSVSLLHIMVEFLDKQSGKPLRVVVDATGKPLVDHNGMVRFDVDANGPPLLIQSFGTGFLVRPAGTIVTNHHVVEPWWNDHDLTQLLGRGVIPHVLSYEAYFPGRSVAIRAKLDRISSKADLATLKLEGPAPPQAESLELADGSEESVTGEPVVLIGFPTGVDGILARAGSEVAQKIAGGTQNVSLIASQLASQHLIRPITTQGHIGDILKDKIVHDAATTFGGSGAPLFNRNGKVIGINSAVIEGFGGSNLAVPARYANDLLK
jgi:S1-C subfamily serine protease/DNA-binding response OmpR family regulator